MAEVKREYYKTGELKSECFEINDRKNGEYKKYYENGSELSLDNSKRKNLSSTDSFGQLKEICSYIDGGINGEYKRYYESGKILNICSYIGGIKNGEYKEYHKNGQLSYICSYIDDEINGEKKEYHENGRELSLTESLEKINAYLMSLE